MCVGLVLGLNVVFAHSETDMRICARGIPTPTCTEAPCLEPVHTLAVALWDQVARARLDFRWLGWTPAAPVEIVAIGVCISQPRFKKKKDNGVLILHLRIPGTVPGGYLEYPDPLEAIF